MTRLLAVAAVCAV